LKNCSFLIIGINFKPELTGIGRYTGEMVEWLTKNGVSCTVITAFPYYPHWKIQAPYSGLWYKKEISNNGLLKIYRCPIYIPKKITGIGRIIHEVSLLISSLFIIFLLLFRKKITNILCIAPPFLIGINGLIYKFFKGGKLYYHAQDLQIEAAKNLGMIKSSLLLNFLSKLEQQLLPRYNQISTLNKQMAVRQNGELNLPIKEFPNWVNCHSFFPILNKEMLKEKFGFGKNDKIILYSGSMGEKQGINILLELGQRMNKFENVSIVLSGTGPYYEQLKTKGKNIKNLIFVPLQSENVFNEFLNLADVHLVIQKNDASDLMMPSKINSILATGGILLATVNPNTTVYNLINENKIGFTCKPDSIEELFNGINQILNNNNFEISKNARDYALRHLETEKILGEFFHSILE
jgi:colanic acid biosynthesis glycosyl transferase WcaI